MRAYTVHLPPTDSLDGARFVPEGFTFAGCVFGPAWLLFHQAWPFALVAAAGFLLGPWPVGLGVGLLCGVLGQDARRAMLAWRKWQLAGVVVAGSADEAECRWMERGRMPPGHSPAMGCGA